MAEKLTLESLAAEVAELTEKVENLTSENETLSEKVEKLATALKESTVQREVEVVETPVDISTLSFTADKTTYKFARPSVSIEEGGKFVTYKASEVAEDEKLQAKFAELAANGQTIFVVAQK